MNDPEKRRQITFPTEMALWIGAWSGILLPVLSHCGYSAFGAVYLSFLLIAGLMGLLTHVLSRFRWAGALLLMLVLVLMSSLYYGGLLAASFAVNLVYHGLLVACIVPCLRKPGLMLRMLGLAGYMQVLVAICFTTPALGTAKEGGLTARGGSAKPVIQILLDEHTGLDSFPKEADHIGGVDRLIEMYVSRGFIVFSKAYTCEYETYRSVARFFNTSSPQFADSVPLRGGRHGLMQGSDLKRIAIQRDIDATYTNYVDMHRVLADSGALVRERGYEFGLQTEEATVRYGMCLQDRLRLASWEMLNWFHLAAKFPPLYHHFEGIKEEAAAPIMQSFVPQMQPYSLSGALELEDFCGRLAEGVTTGMYYYGHFLIPHHPYVFDSAGRLRPIDSWLNRVVWPPGQGNTMETRRMRYALHLEQALYAGETVTGLADALDRRLSRNGSVMIVHGDHGTRIGLLPYPEGYTQVDYQKDMRATFLAVRIPGEAGRVETRPVRVDFVLKQLLEANYEAIDPESLPLTTDNPFVD